MRILAERSAKPRLERLGAQPARPGRAGVGAGRLAAGRQRAVANEEPHFDVAVERGLGEVRRSHEDRLVVDHEGLGVQDARGTF